MIYWLQSCFIPFGGQFLLRFARGSPGHLGLALSGLKLCGFKAFGPLKGEPKVITWTGGIFPPSTFVISPQMHHIGESAFWLWRWALFQLSLAHTGRIPHREAARGNTPIPSKRLPSLMSGMARVPCPFTASTLPALSPQCPAARQPQYRFYILVHSAAADDQGVGAPQHIPAHINPGLVFLGNAVIQKQRQIQERADRGKKPAS